MYISFVVSRPASNGGRAAFTILIQIHVSPRLIVTYLKIFPIKLISSTNILGK